MAANKRIPRVYPVCQVLEVYDGDSLRVSIDVGFSTLCRVWLRLKDVRAPELRQTGGLAARDDVQRWLSEHAPDGLVEVTTFWSQGTLREIHEDMTFVRYVAVVRATDGADLNQWLLDRGYSDQGF